MSISELFHPNFYNIFVGTLTEQIPSFESGQYTPVAVALVNISSITPINNYYLKIHDIVIVHGRISYDLIVPGINSSLSISLPVPKTINFINIDEAQGHASQRDSSIQSLFSSGIIEAILGTQTIKIDISSSTTNPNLVCYSFAYKI